MTPQQIRIGDPLSLADVVAVARHGAPVALTDAARQRVRESRARVGALLERDEAVYGINTGFGRLANVRVPHEDVKALQRNLIVSHAVAVGAPLPTEVVRGMLLLRAQSLAVGVSGVRLDVLDVLVECLNRGVHPIIPSQGSVGSSGDLAPLAHMALALIGLGMVEHQGTNQPAARAFDQLGLQPLTLAAKEGLALINGTQAMTAIAALVLDDAVDLATCADIAGAMSLEALDGALSNFDHRIMAVRPHPGAALVAENVRRLAAGSEIHESRAECRRVQDAYSLRCIPQVHGASRDALAHSREVVGRELNSATDNPLIFAGDDVVLSGGNFHGQPVALAMDYSKIAVAELANISERRTAHLQDPALSGLPPFLTRREGLHSGLMITQYTAASLVSENKVIAHPASVDSIPTSANQEDHVSMGTTSARQARQVLENARWVVAIELLNAAQGLDFRRPLRPAAGTGAALAAVREVVASLDGDRPLQDDLHALYSLVASGRLREAVESAIGALN
ncbi:MAG TPA: histidine ammonia-lyase [Gemmatimonadaceae bacterium]|nr:histidine ammonia-lyase [Gemmatimonadaceae bacterium]